MSVIRDREKRNLKIYPIFGQPEWKKFFVFDYCGTKGNSGNNVA